MGRIAQISFDCSDCYAATVYLVWPEIMSTISENGEFYFDENQPKYPYKAHKFHFTKRLGCFLHRIISVIFINREILFVCDNDHERICDINRMKYFGAQIFIDGKEWFCGPQCAIVKNYRHYLNCISQKRIYLSVWKNSCVN